MPYSLQAQPAPALQCSTSTTASVRQAFGRQCQRQAENVVTPAKARTVIDGVVGHAVTSVRRCSP